jgi:nucleotide-binding universal stress UspA family protein
MKNVLLAVDDSPGSKRAVEFVGEMFAGLKDLRVTLFHVLSGVPPELWDDGHILSTEEKAARRELTDRWKAGQKQQLTALFQEAAESLNRKGLSLQQVQTKSLAESGDPAECILTEARNGSYQTLVVGRCGHSPAAHMILGSIAGKIVNYGAGIAICVVE